MSLLFPEKLTIHLAPGVVVVARTKRAMIVQSDARTVVADAEFGWRPLVDALAEMLGAYANATSTTMVTLSSRLAPVAAMPWRDDVTEPASQALLAAARLSRSYGGTPADWDCLAIDHGFGRPWLTCGARHEMIAALKSALTEAHLRVTSIAPLAVDLFNAHRVSLPARGAAWLLVPEADRLSAWYCQSRIPQECISLPLPADEDGALNELLRREALLRGMPDASTTLFVAASQASGSLATSGVQRLLPRWRCAPGMIASYPLHWLGGAR